MLLPKLAEYRRKYPVRRPPDVDWSDNLWAQHAPTVENVMLRANNKVHASTNEESTLNTLRYMFFHMKCGIFVMVRQSRILMFVPFVNRDYKNTWSEFMTFEHRTQQRYYQVKWR